MKRILIGAATLLVFSYPSLSTAQTVEIMINDYAFTPRNITIRSGDTVRWTNKVDNQHTVTSGKDGVPDGVWASKRLGKDETFSYTFESPGGYYYYCTPHNAFNMNGLIEVKEQ